MKIETDAVVHGYAFRMVAKILEPMATMRFSKQNHRLLERALMTVLEGMVASGAADHKYDESRNLDSFISTEKLVQNWSWVFPGDKLSINRSERHVFEIKGKRARYFNNRWLAPDPNNPIPSWPN